MDSAPSRPSNATAKHKSSLRDIPPVDQIQVDDSGKVRTAGPASAQYKSSKSTLVVAPPPVQEPFTGGKGASGTLGRGFASRLLGRGASLPTAPASASPQGQELSSYADQQVGGNASRKSLLSGLSSRSRGKDEVTPAQDGDMRMTRWNNRKKAEHVITKGMTDLDLDDDETEVAKPIRNNRQRENSFGLGGTSHDQALDQSSMAFLTSPREGGLFATRSIRRAPNSSLVLKHQLSDDVLVARASTKRSGSIALRSKGFTSSRSEPLQLPVFSARGTGGHGSIVRESHDVEPDYEYDESAERRSDSAAECRRDVRPTSLIVEEDEDDEEFQEADDSGFPVTPGGPEAGDFTVPDTIDEDRGTEPADVIEQDTVTPIIDPAKSVAAIVQEHAAVSEPSTVEDISSYDENIAREAPRKNGGHHTAKALAGRSAADGLLAIRTAVIGIGHSKKLSQSNGVPGGISDPDDTSVDYDTIPAAVPAEDLAVHEDEDDISASGTPGVAAAPASPVAKTVSKAKGSSKKPQPALAAPPLLTRKMSPPPPEKPQKSKARKPSEPRTPALATAPSPSEAKYYSGSKKQAPVLAGGEVLTVGGASSAAAAHYLDGEDEPAILSEEDGEDESWVDDYEHPPPRDLAASKETKSSKHQPYVPATRPSRRSRPVQNLTPVQRHYLLKALVNLQMQQEWEDLEKLGALTQYGYPFSAERPKLTRVSADLKNEYTTGDDMEEQPDDPYAYDSNESFRSENLQQPLILRHLFHIHIRSFPGLDQAPLKFWQQRIQVFFDEMAVRNFSTSVERAEYSKRRFYTLVATRYLGSYFARGVGVRGKGELRGPGPGEKGSERWGVGKQWGKGTVKRGLDRPARINTTLWSKIDALFGEGLEGRLWRRAGKETTRVRGDWQAWKEQIIENELGLEETIDFLNIRSVRNLPAKYRNAEEWARNHAAYLLHALFVSTPGADSTYKVVKGIHSLFPYWGAKQLLKYTNAQVLIEGILNLLLARPAGAKSLIQRITTYVISSEGTLLQKEYISPLRRAIKDPELTNRIDEYVNRGNRPEGRAVRAKAEKTGDDVLSVILLSAGGSPLRRDTQERVVELQDAYARSPLRGNLEMAYPADSTFAKEQPDKVQLPRWGVSRAEMEDALKFARLKLYLRDSLKCRDREQATKVASGALVPTIIKDVLQTVMYDVIKQVANNADLSARLGDLQAFVEDLLEVKKRKDDSIEAWIALAARHENSFYYFVHECSAIAKSFFDWCQIGLDYMALSTTDPQHPADRRAKNIEVNLEELLQDSRLSEKDVELILEEIDELAVYTKWSKVAYELEMRKNFLLAYSEAATTSKLTKDEVPAQMKDDIRDVDGLMRELMESEGVPVDDGTLPNESRGTEARDLPTLWFDVMDPLGQHLRAEGGSEAELTYSPRKVSPPIPCLKYIRKAVPVFREVLQERLPDWQHGNASGPKKKTVASSSNGRDFAASPIDERKAKSAKKSKGLFGR